MRAIIEGFADPAIAPFIEPDQTENIVLRINVCYFTINPTESRSVIVETKVSPDDLAVVMRGKVSDQIIASAPLELGSLIKQDIIFPDFTKG